MKKSITKIVAQNYLLPNTKKLLAQCLGIPIYPSSHDNKYIWIENCAGVRIGKIKHGEYSIYNIHNVLYPIIIKMIKPSTIYSRSQFMLFSGADPISSNNDIIKLSANNCIRIVKCNNLFADSKSHEIVGVHNMFSVYRHWDGTKNCSYIKLIYDKSGLKHEYTRGAEYNLELIKDLFGYDIYSSIVKYYNSYIYNHLHGIKNKLDPFLQSKLSKLYQGYKTGILKDGNRHIDIHYIKYNLCKIQPIQQMCYDRLSAFKSINTAARGPICFNKDLYPYDGPIPLIFII
jgi:hypothetical protein